ncbi:tetratricopeptide repeat protein 39C-like [Portunus trituberculatus]|uniref:tetratricopeptide repeat protein 39C-like n=1 Tax=Portunus trituberculatus TaxID=210409 RepID=UPI001E1D0571|nr:tetratricopeptide repeat protein 39C-like [Portunus trituberculatus]XP_045127819.1 tetratricopeptide repeat protein 39C-like [Portunus trituberculatus]XP_045127820.1 tetratricopeptide repeat protein 39C-like [Portunus trituberculatus]XP_045127821.1 tetratricopeptide repeat protein 39C-like [Portunus trituberculatus]XP_045127822.1 tetratricopeptide repeat protein 39C-like [Portunus trituberculatus]
MCSAGGTSDTSGGGDGKNAAGNGGGGEEEVSGDARNGQSLGPEEYTRLARDGIQLMLNNRFTEAEELFRHHTQDNLHMAMGYCYLTFMNAVMSFEEEKVNHSMETLRSMERRCGGNDNGWLSSVRNIVLGSRNGHDQGDEPGAQLEQQVVLADCQVLLAILTFLQQEIGSYVKGGWVLRKAWKVYEHSYMKVKRMYRQTFGEAQDMPMTPGDDCPGSLQSSSDQLQSPGSWSVGSTGVPGPAQEEETSSSHTSVGLRLTLSKSVPNLKGFLNSNHRQNSKKPLPPDMVARLMASVSFGYGLFQLCTSLLPPSLLRLVNVLGLQGDRLAGLSALMFTRKSHDMRAPLATLTLLWYHTIVRPFFALDGSKVKAGVEAAHLLLQEAQQSYSQSALFLFFRGRVHRLQGDITTALVAYRGALQVSPQRELQLLALHEVAWCHLLQLNWVHAQGAFANLKRESRWSKSFYAYISAVCLGAAGREEECQQGLQEVPSLVRRTNHALEAFLLRRALKSKNTTVNRNYCLLRAYELLYLWNAISSCSTQHRLQMVEELQTMGQCDELEGLRHLLLAAILDTMANTEEAMEHFRLSVQHGLLNPDEMCVPAFALYELGLLLSSSEETLQEGKKCLEDVRDNYQGYDFENRLNVRVHAALRSLP